MDGRTRRVEPVGDLDDRYSIADTPSNVGFRRHLRNQPERPSGGDLPDAPRSGDPRRGNQRIRQRVAA